ncbi:MAG: YceI family protein [Marinibacterium sp.]
MTAYPRRHILALTGIALASAALPGSARAKPRAYRLDAAASKVAFTFGLNGAPQKGTMPVSQADILVDPQRLGSSSVDVTLAVDKTRTALVLATEALKSPDILDAARFPVVRFRSTRVRLAPDGRLSGGATLTGALTIRDVTRPVTFQAGIFRPKGSAPDDLSRLTVRLTGAISRSAFGASGYAGLVDDRVTLDITAAIARD